MQDTTTNNYYAHDVLYVLDTVTIDSQYRFTITKKIRNFFPVQPGDIFALFEHTKANTLIMKLQRENLIAGAWEIRVIP
ncbi:hypothetical protein Ngar_c30290 [Candidatus Nitrososphaera gargensis Ga9.2]|uniref:Uncharacterized protein n=1 Tax=Nitrososphaera gargensis (strain Ga9.2) TaxID=1237085 RepID=K0IIY3_NITGG|nr:hypothetical protein [Candidatus Nitrososphaera gargensis]AFU59945.1 hypothetical protein Ngar_c30290 [Candidatus Nitrososphaera gargensis Ga9.2]